MDRTEQGCWKFSVIIVAYNIKSYLLTNLRKYSAYWFLYAIFKLPE